MILEWLMPLRRYGISNEITNPWAQCYLRPVFRLIEGETMTFEEPKYPSNFYSVFSGEGCRG